MSVSQKQKIDKIARVLTNILSPITAVLIAMIVIYLNFIPHSIKNAIIYFLIVVGGIFLGFITVLIFKKTGLISDFDIHKREERPRVFAIFLLIMAIIDLAIFVMNFKVAFTYLLMSTIAFAIAFFITIFWKISIHTFSITLAILLLFEIHSSPILIPLLAIPIITAWTRIRLKKHTRNQTIGGIFLATWMYFLFAILL